MRTRWSVSMTTHCLRTSMEGPLRRPGCGGIRERSRDRGHPPRQSGKPFGVRTDKDGFPNRAELIQIGRQTRKKLLPRHHRSGEAERLRPKCQVGADDYSRRKRPLAYRCAQKLNSLYCRKSIACDRPWRNLCLCPRPRRFCNESAGRERAVAPGRQPRRYMAGSLCRRFGTERRILECPRQLAGAGRERMQTCMGNVRPSPTPRSSAYVAVPRCFAPENQRAVRFARVKDYHGKGRLVPNSLPTATGLRQSPPAVPGRLEGLRRSPRRSVPAVADW